MRHFLPASFFLILLACGQQDSTTMPADSAGDGAPAGARASNSSQVTEEPVACSGSENLLVNPGFLDDLGSSTASWISTQHAGDVSFRLSIEGGEVTIERIGPEPWFNFLQVVDVEGLEGHELYFEAELKLDLNADDWPHRLTPGGGKQILIWGRAIPTLPNSRLMLTSDFEEDMNLGKTDWFTVRSQFEMPDSPTEFKVGFVHQANGSFSIRNPVLFDCGKKG